MTDKKPPEGEQPPPPPVSPSPSTSTADADEAVDPQRVGPVKLKGQLPEPVEHVEKRVGPVKLPSTS